MDFMEWGWDPYGKYQCKDLNASILPDSSEVELKSSGMAWIPPDSDGRSACKYICVYINCLCSLSMSLSHLGYALSFLGYFSHNTIIVAPSLTFPNVLKSSLVLFHGKK